MMDNIAEADIKDVKLKIKLQHKRAIKRRCRAIFKAKNSAQVNAEKEKCLRKSLCQFYQRQQEALQLNRQAECKVTDNGYETTNKARKHKSNETLLKSFIKTAVYLQEYPNTSKPFERTYVVGIEEATHELHLNHVKLIFIATNLPMRDSFWVEMNHLRGLCNRNGVPYLFAFKRKALSNLVLKPVNHLINCCVAILKYEGVEEKYSQLLNQLRGEPKTVLLNASRITDNTLEYSRLVNQMRGTPKTQLLNDFTIEVNTIDGTRNCIVNNSVATLEATESMSMDEDSTLGVNEVKEKRPKKTEKVVRIKTEPSNDENEFFVTPVSTLRVNEANKEHIRDNVTIKTECDVSNDLSNNSGTLLEGIKSEPSGN